jgi:hypothetical protein
MIEPNLDVIVEEYVRLRDEKALVEKWFKDRRAPDASRMKYLEGQMLATLNKLQCEAVRTAHGTVSKILVATSTVEDWDLALKTILDNELFHLLTRQVNKAGALEYLEEYKEPFPGTKLTRAYVARVQKS